MIDKDSFKAPIAILKLVFDILFALTHPENDEDYDWNNEYDDDEDYGWGDEYDDDEDY